MANSVLLAACSHPLSLAVDCTKQCHKIENRERVAFFNGKNKLSIEEYPQCEPIRTSPHQSRDSHYLGPFRVCVGPGLREQMLKVIDSTVGFYGKDADERLAILRKASLLHLFPA
jgi:hypothetical protein